MAAAVAAARSALRSAATSARSATATVNPRLAPSPFRISRSPFAANQGTIAHYSSDPKPSSNSKRFQRIQRKKIDLKRSNSCVGIVEGIEYDAHRNSRIALVRWEGGAKHRKSATVDDVSFSLPERKLESSITATITGTFPFSQLDPIEKPSAKDVFTSAFSKGETSYLPSSRFPRIAVAGAKPSFFAFVKREKYADGQNTFSLSQIEKWNPENVLYENRMKRQAAISWHSFAKQGNLGALRESERKGLKGKKDYAKANRAPISYILASRHLQKGSMVMNFAKPPTSDLSRRSQKANA